MKSQILLQTDSNNCYFLNNSNKYLSNCHPIMFYLLDLINRRENIIEWFDKQADNDIKIYESNYSKDVIKYYLSKVEYLQKHGLIKPSHNLENHFELSISSEKVNSIIANVDSVGFEVTDSCNLNCRYCIYGEIYNEDDFDKRINKHLSFKKVKNLLDFLIERSESEGNVNHQKELLVNFYGGEPLLNFDLIKRTVLYLKQLKLNKTSFKFGMTTNCVLLNRYADFLVENDFTLLCSLDGNERNNGHRIFHNGKEAFNLILDNLKSLKKNYPTFFNTRVFFNSVLHNLNSVKDIHDFFKEEFDKMPAISEISSFGVKEESKEIFLNTYQNMKSSFRETEGCPEVKKDMYNLSFEYSQTLNFLTAYSPFIYEDYNHLLFNRDTRFYPTATCLPFSRKIFLNVNGRVLPCENVDHKKSTLGTVSEENVEIDSVKIAGIYNEFYQQLIKKCKSCYNIHSCTYCAFTKGIRSETGKIQCDEFFNYTNLQKYLASKLNDLEKQPELYSQIMKEEVLK